MPPSTPPWSSFTIRFLAPRVEVDHQLIFFSRPCDRASLPFFTHYAASFSIAWDIFSLESFSRSWRCFTNCCSSWCCIWSPMSLILRDHSIELDTLGVNPLFPESLPPSSYGILPGLYPLVVSYHFHLPGPAMFKVVISDIPPPTLYLRWRVFHEPHVCSTGIACFLCAFHKNLLANSIVWKEAMPNTLHTSSLFEGVCMFFNAWTFSGSHTKW